MVVTGVYVLVLVTGADVKGVIFKVADVLVLGSSLK